MQVLEDCMNDRIDRYLEERGRSLSDRRNGSFSRHLLTELGDFEIYPTQHLLIFKPLIFGQISRKY